jgi:hypothetical protein
MLVKNKQKNKVKYLTPRSRKPGALALLGWHWHSVAFSYLLVGSQFASSTLVGDAPSIVPQNTHRV